MADIRETNAEAVGSPAEPMPTEQDSEPGYHEVRAMPAGSADASSHYSKSELKTPDLLPPRNIACTRCITLKVKCVVTKTPCKRCTYNDVVCIVEDRKPRSRQKEIAEESEFEDCLGVVDGPVYNAGSKNKKVIDIEPSAQCPPNDIFRSTSSSKLSGWATSSIQALQTLSVDYDRPPTKNTVSETRPHLDGFHLSYDSSDSSQENDQIIRQKHKDAKARLSHTCARCKDLKVRCEPRTDTTSCNRCHNGGHQCVHTSLDTTGLSAVITPGNMSPSLPVEDSPFGLCYNPNLMPSSRRKRSIDTAPAIKVQGLFDSLAKVSQGEDHAIPGTQSLQVLGKAHQCGHIASPKQGEERTHL